MQKFVNEMSSDKQVLWARIWGLHRQNKTDSFKYFRRKRNRDTAKWSEENLGSGHETAHTRRVNAGRDGTK